MNQIFNDHSAFYATQVNDDFIANQSGKVEKSGKTNLMTSEHHMPKLLIVFRRYVNDFPGYSHILGAVQEFKCKYDLLMNRILTSPGVSKKIITMI